MLSPTDPLGRLLRLPLRLIPRTAVLPVLSGANRGRKWTVGAGTHGCWLGRYERQEIDRILSKIGPDSVVWDIGAHAGFVTMACATRCRHVVACEASVQNAQYLRSHVALNGLRNVSIVEAAICAQDDAMVSFGTPADGYQGRIGGSGSSVRTATIDALVHSGLPAPNFIKMDIEGGEADALRGGMETFRAYRPALLLAVHSEALARECRNLLESAGYRIEEINAATLWAYTSYRRSHDASLSQLPLSGL